MKKLKTEFNKHGARYVLKKRTDRVAMYYVYGSQSSPDYVTHIEVFIIRTVDDQYGFREKYPAIAGLAQPVRQKPSVGSLNISKRNPFMNFFQNIGMMKISVCL